ncbi:chromatin assembly complex, subunit p90 [Paramyrothecium foliicola]|nr:chromatin assembly complex, subunit p90 [Paramyrothecium foliicola]
MTLTEMSPNIKEAESVGRKRSHDEFSGDVLKAGRNVPNLSVKIIPSSEDRLSEIDLASDQSSPLSSPALTEAGSSTPTRLSPYPLTPTKTTSGTSNDKREESPSQSSAKQTTTMTNPPAKRKRLTAAEKAAKDKEIEDKKKEKEEKASAKAAEKAKQEEEKAARLKEREEKRRKKEEEDKAKAQQRDEKKRKKEEEQQRIQEEKDRKARSQKTLNNFFKAPSTPKKPAGEAIVKSESPSVGEAAPTTSKPTITPYQKMFKPFFIRDNMRMAACLQMDDEIREAKSESLDDFLVRGESDTARVAPFNPTKLLGLPPSGNKRGRQYHPVKHIMEFVYKQMASSNNVGTDETNRIIKQAQEKLAKVPVKVIAFAQDVRPPYYGTITYQPYALGSQHMRSLARRSVNRVLPLDYDFDSEAEWQEEEGEDVDMDDDEEELDEEDDMDGFLDDSEDAGLSRRIFANTIEPDSTGVCFEDAGRVAPNSAVYEHRMEFMHESLERNAEVNPWSAEYWEPEPKTKAAKAGPSNEKAKMPPPPAPTNAFEALTNTSNSSGAAAPGKLVKAELMTELKQTILENKALSKVGIIDFIFHKLKGRASRTEVSNTLAYVAEKTGTGRAKEWSLKEGHGLGL